MWKASPSAGAGSGNSGGPGGNGSAAKSIIIEILKILVIAGVFVALGYFFKHGGNFAKNLPERSQLLDEHLTDARRQMRCGLPSKDGRAIPISMVYSDDMRAWVELAVDRFSAVCPSIQIKLTALPDIEAADDILEGRLSPTVWAPTDEFALRYLDHRLKQRGQKTPFRIVDAKELVFSPIVSLIWQDQLRVLTKILAEERSPEGQWMRTLCSQIPREPVTVGVAIEDMVPGNWLSWYAPLAVAVVNKKGIQIPVPLVTDEPIPGAEALRAWGRVKIAHAKPTRDSAGLSTLYLMAYDYVLPPAERVVRSPHKDEEPAPADEEERYTQGILAHRLETALEQKKSALRTWLRRCEAGLDATPKTSLALTTAMFNTGPSLYDSVITYEHLALPYLDRVDSHAAAMRKLVIVYPEPTLIARHPAVLFSATPQQQEAAQRWLQFLLSKQIQEKAIEAGFRPVNPDVTIRGYNVEQNRFLRLRRYGVMVEPRLVEAPRTDGGLLQELIALWGEVTGRN